MRLKAIQEISGLGVMEPTLEELLDYRGDKMVPAAESTPHPAAVRYSSQVQGAAFLHEPEGDDSLMPSADFNQLQTA